MPTLPPSPCSHPGCPQLVPGRASRCPEHSHDHTRPNAYQRGYGGAAWRQTRATVIARDQGICQECGVGGARQVAHIKARRHGGSDDPSNLRLLCDSCHSRETIAEFGIGRTSC